MSAQACRGDFVMLRAGALRLLLPRSDVGAAEHIGAAPRGTARQGVFEHEVLGRRCALVALSEQLQPLADFPADRFVLTRMGGDEAPFMAWDEVRVLIDASCECRPLPPAMRTPTGPIEAYAEIDGDLLLCTTAARLLAYAGSTGE